MTVVNSPQSSLLPKHKFWITESNHFLSAGAFIIFMYNVSTLLRSSDDLTQLSKSNTRVVWIPSSLLGTLSFDHSHT